MVDPSPSYVQGSFRDRLLKLASFLVPSRAGGCGCCNRFVVFDWRKMTSVTPYKIAHLSDLHLTSLPNAKRSEPRIGGQLSGMNNAFRRVALSEPVQQSDLVFITGDVTDKGDPAAWKVLRDTLIEAKLKSKTLVIIGNHDVCGLGARLGWPSQLAKLDLEKARQGLKIAGQPTRYPWAKIVEPRVVIFGLDTNNSGNLTAIDNAVGRIGIRQLERFARLLYRHRNIPVKIVAIHHSPNIPRHATALRRGQMPMSLVNRWAHQIPQDDRRMLRLLCATHKVRLIVHGHLHEAEDRRLGSVRIVGAPATTEPIDRKAHPRQYQFYQYIVRGMGGRVDRSLVTV